MIENIKFILLKKSYGFSVNRSLLYECLQNIYKLEQLSPHFRDIPSPAPVVPAGIRATAPCLEKKSCARIGCGGVPPARQVTDLLHLPALAAKGAPGKMCSYL